MNRYPALLLLFSCAFLLSSAQPLCCEEPSYFDFATRDHCIRNYALSFNNRDLDQYTRILHEDFQFILAPDKILDRAKEIESTKSMFEMPGTVAAIAIETGAWTPVDTLDGCWETVREYTLVVSRPRADYASHHRCRFVVAPVVADADTTWKIRVVQDLGPVGTAGEE